MIHIQNYGMYVVDTCYTLNFVYIKSHTLTGCFCLIVLMVKNKGGNFQIHHQQQISNNI